MNICTRKKIKFEQLYNIFSKLAWKSLKILTWNFFLLFLTWDIPAQFCISLYISFYILLCIYYYLNIPPTYIFFIYILVKIYIYGYILVTIVIYSISVFYVSLWTTKTIKVKVLKGKNRKFYNRPVIKTFQVDQCVG